MFEIENRPRVGSSVFRNGKRNQSSFQSLIFRFSCFTKVILNLITTETNDKWRCKIIHQFLFVFLKCFVITKIRPPLRFDGGIIFVWCFLIFDLVFHDKSSPSTVVIHGTIRGIKWLCSYAGNLNSNYVFWMRYVLRTGGGEWKSFSHTHWLVLELKKFFMYQFQIHYIVENEFVLNVQSSYLHFCFRLCWLFFIVVWVSVKTLHTCYFIFASMQLFTQARTL